MAETVIQEITDDNQEKTFTQEEVNAIVGERVRRESAKYADYETLKAKASKYDEAEEASKSELQKAQERADALQTQINQMNAENELRGIRDKVAKETGVPAELLFGSDEETCKAQAEAIKAYANPGYPTVKDGGELQKRTTKPTTADQFAEWFEAQLN